MSNTKIMYIMSGFYIARDWYGTLGLMEIHDLEISEEDFQEILEDPLQDYNSFGVASIEYVNLTFYKKIITPQAIVIMRKPYKTIEQHAPNVDPKEIEEFSDAYFNQTYAAYI